MSTVQESTRFSQVHEAHIQLFDSQPWLSTLPNYSHVQQDHDGSIELTVRNLRRDADDWPVFDLDYAYAAPGQVLGEPQPLADYMAPNAAFAHTTDRLAALIVEDGSRVYLPATVLDSSEGLFELAHEMGHTHQIPLIKHLRTLALHGTVDSSAVTDGLLTYGPALTALDNYVIKHGDLIEDSYRSGELTTDMTELQAWEFVIKTRHPEANAAVNAALEADAWLFALQMVERGVLHPGLSRDDLLYNAFFASATYDCEFSNDLHTKTLQHALSQQ